MAKAYSAHVSIATPGHRYALNEVVTHLDESGEKRGSTVDAFRHASC